MEAAAGGWLARWRVSRPRAAVPELPPPLESGAEAPSAAAGKRRVDFSAPVPPSKRAWVVPPCGATVQASLGGARHRGSGWLHWLAQSEREAREAEAAAEVAAERCRYRVGRGTGREGTGRHRLAVHVLGGLVDILDFGGGRWEVCMETIFTIG